MSDIYISEIPKKSDYHLLFETCIRDIAFIKEQQWKTVHLTIIALVALLVGINEGIMQRWVAFSFVLAVAVCGLVFMGAHQFALIKRRKKKNEIISGMPGIFDRLHPSKSDWDIYIFSFMFMVVIAAFAAFVLWHAVTDC